MVSRFVHLFLPHTSNNHRPRVLHHFPLAVLISLLITFQAATSLIAQLYPNVLGYAAQIPAPKVIELTNNQRQKYGLSPLTVDSKLTKAAQAKAEDMFREDYWAHNSPTGVKPWSFILAAGYNYLHAGENLARDFTQPEAIVDAWMASPTHRENILGPLYRHIGIVVVDGRLNGVETTLVIQMFGTPQSAAPQVGAAETSSIIPPARAQETVEAYPTPVPSLSLSPIFNSFTISKIISLSFIILILTVLAVDWFIAWRRNLIRLSGRNWAHLTYLALIAALALIIKQGLIL